MRFPAFALVGFAAASLICNDCDVRWIDPAHAQASVHSNTQIQGTDIQPAINADPEIVSAYFPLLPTNDSRIVATEGGNTGTIRNDPTGVFAGRFEVRR